MNMLNPFKAIKNYFNEKDIEWTSKLHHLGFDKIHFPIIIKDGPDLDVVYELRDFAIDSDFYFHEFDQQIEMIDSTGQLWDWKYDTVNKTNLPNTVKRTLTFDEVNTIINLYFQGTNMELDIKEQTGKVSTINMLIDIIADKL